MGLILQFIAATFVFVAPVDSLFTFTFTILFIVNLFLALSIMVITQSVQVFGRKKTATAVAYCKKGRGLIKVFIVLASLFDLFS